MTQIAIKPGSVYTFKLTSGEELITKVIQAGGDFITIEEPVSIAPNQKGLGFMPSVFTADPKGEFRLNTSTITIYAETDEDIKMKYIEATTGIQLPEKKILVG
jgi:hypothetical protein